MTRLLVLIAMLLAAAAGSVTAQIWPPVTAEAQAGYQLNVNPGPYRNNVTCGWHQTCVFPYYSGFALDWGNFGGEPVYWRSWAFLSSGSGAVGRAYLTNVLTANCYVIGVDINSLAPYYRGSTSYTHTFISGSNRNWLIPGAVFSGQFLQYGPIGTSVPTNGEKPTCPKDDNGNFYAHLHHTVDGTWTKNTGVYDPAPWTGTGFGLSDLANWMGTTQWIE